MCDVRGVYYMKKSALPKPEPEFEPESESTTRPDRTILGIRRSSSVVL